jgi:ankyrin repeat protein
MNCSETQRCLNILLIKFTMINHLTYVKYLIEMGADVDSIDENGDTPLIICAKKNYHFIARFLLKAGCDIRIKNKEFLTAKNIAVEKDNKKFLKVYNAHIFKDLLTDIKLKQFESL